MARKHEIGNSMLVNLREWTSCLALPLTLLLFLFLATTAFASENAEQEVFPSIGTPEFNEMYYQKMKVLTVDTRDTEACSEVAGDLYGLNRISAAQYEIFCDTDNENPLVSVFIPDEAQNDYGVHIRFSDLTEREQTLVRQTRNMSVVAIGLIGVLFLVPEEMQGWGPGDMDNLGEKYVDNVTTRPEWDGNKWYYNYIGHPISGAAYYQVARHAGFNRAESFAYSVFMSTIFWEYGFEAPFEVPSIQDLIITPVVGSLLGEFFFQKAKSIRENGGTVMGSRFLGNLSLVAMDPAGYLLESINNSIPGDMFVDAEAFVTTGRNASGSAEVRFGIKFYF